MWGFATAGVSFKTMTKEGFGLLAGSWEFYNCSQLLPHCPSFQFLQEARKSSDIYASPQLPDQMVEMLNALKCKI